MPAGQEGGEDCEKLGAGRCRGWRGGEDVGVADGQVLAAFGHLGPVEGVDLYEIVHPAADKAHRHAEGTGGIGEQEAFWRREHRGRSVKEMGSWDESPAGLPP